MSTCPWRSRLHWTETSSSWPPWTPARSNDDSKRAPLTRATSETEKQCSASPRASEVRAPPKTVVSQCQGSTLHSLPTAPSTTKPHVSLWKSVTFGKCGQRYMSSLGYCIYPKSACKMWRPRYCSIWYSDLFSCLCLSQKWQPWFCDNVSFWGYLSTNFPLL